MIIKWLIGLFRSKKQDCGTLTKKQLRVLESISTHEGLKYLAGDGKTNWRCFPIIYFGCGKFHILGPGVDIERPTIESAVSEFMINFKKECSAAEKGGVKKINCSIKN